MKSFVSVILLICFSLFSSAKEKEFGTSVAVDTVLQVPNFTAQQIYQSAKIWLANNMASAQDVIQFDDPANAHIIW